jgi:catechol 2,3-dioxygenase-like lactoylglutathione lyase family enzyme
MIKGVKFVTVPVRDQKSAIEFWTTRVGLQIVTDQPYDDRQRWIELGAAGHPTRIVPFELEGWDQRIGDFLNIVFYSDDVERTYKEMSARGVEFLGTPDKRSWGTSVVFKDQDGTKFLLSSK